jgi:phenylalanyl-tRNA synthetase beta chain
MQLRLRSAGVRPINNVVDITNYVLMETGQPLHGFDLDQVAGEEIIVRRAEAGERLRTLDGVDRDLSEWDLVIADTAGVVAFAGVMGGATSEVGDGTTRVLIEAAHFDAPSVMFTARRHDLRTEASSRFERGVDPNLPGRAADRAAALIVELAGGQAVSGVQDNYPEPIEPWPIELSLHEVPRLLGIELDRDVVVELLALIGFTSVGQDPLTVTVPTFRPDVRRPADLVEEVARLHGYDQIPETLPLGTGGGLTEAQVAERRIVGLMTGLGFSEAQSWSFVSADDLDDLGLSADDPRRRGIAVKNPLRDVEPLLRTTLLPGLLKSARFNTSYGADRVALFEIGKIFLAEPSPIDARIPYQPDRLAFVAVGEFGPRQVSEGHRVADVYTATATCRALVDSLGLPNTELQQSSPDGYHPGRAADVSLDGVIIGSVGELHPSVVRAFGLEGRVAAGELALEPLVTPRAWWAFREPSTYPPVVFDLAFDLDMAVPSAGLVTAISDSAGPWLESAQVFDEFSGAQMDEGRKSVAVQLWFRAPDHTLTNEEVAPHRDRIINRVEDLLDARLRGGT